MRVEQVCFFNGMRVVVGPRFRSEEWLRRFVYPLGGVECRGHVQYPALTPVSSKVAVGVMVSLYLLGPEFAPAACRQFFLVLYSFFAFCSSRRDVSRCRLCSKGPWVPGLSQTQVLSGV